MGADVKDQFMRTLAPTDINFLVLFLNNIHTRMMIMMMWQYSDFLLDVFVQIFYNKSVYIYK